MTLPPCCAATSPSTASTRRSSAADAATERSGCTAGPLPPTAKSLDMRRRRATLLAAVASLLTLAAVVPSVSRAANHCSTDWPTFQHDSGRTASATCTDLSVQRVPTLAPQWFVPTSGDVTAEPAIAAGRAYVGDGTGQMHAVDMTTGTSAWSFDVTNNHLHVDRHAVSYGHITSSATVATVPALG